MLIVVMWDLCAYDEMYYHPYFTYGKVMLQTKPRIENQMFFSSMRALVHDDAVLFHLTVQFKTFQGSLLLLACL